MITTPDAQHGPAALDPEGKYPEWQQTIAARSVLPMGGYRPGRVARKVSDPLLVVVAEDDQTALAKPAIHAAQRAPNASILRVPGGHYAPFLAQHELVVQAELDFFKTHLLRPAAASELRPRANGRDWDHEPRERELLVSEATQPDP